MAQAFRHHGRTASRRHSSSSSSLGAAHRRSSSELHHTAELDEGMADAINAHTEETRARDAGAKDAMAWIATEQHGGGDHTLPATTSSDEMSAAHASESALIHPENTTLDVPSRDKPGMGSRTSSSSKLQSAARKIAAARILSNMDDFEPRTPGIDPRRVDLPDLKAPVVIQAVDCSRSSADFSVLDSSSLAAFLEKDRPAWAKLRWLHVNGISWDVIKQIGIKYDLHPLAVEDLLHASTTRSKVDYYRNSAFVNLVSHRSLDIVKDSDDEDEAERDPLAAHKRSNKTPANTTQPGHRFGFHSSTRNDEEYVVESADRNSIMSDYGSGATTPAQPGTHAHYIRKLRQAFQNVQSPAQVESRMLSHTSSGLTNRLRTRGKGKRFRKTMNERAAARWTVAELTKDVKVHIHVEQVAVFLLRNGTIISFTQDPGYHPQFSAIFDRMASTDELIRETEDASMVLQALLDVMGDQLLEIVDDFRAQLTKLEAHVLSRPTMTDVRHLHILSSQLLMLKSTVQPFQFLLHALRLQDDAKAAAAAAAKPAPFADDNASMVPGEPTSGAGSSSSQKLGFVSHEAKVYLGDVIDHVDSVLSSLDLFGDLSENLVGYTFNDLNFKSTVYMQALSVLSVVFLPLTFLSGYFGMNFETFPPILGDVWYFWKIAIPTTVVAVTLFGWEYLAAMVQTLMRVCLRRYHRASIDRQVKLE